MISAKVMLEWMVCAVLENLVQGRGMGRLGSAGASQAVQKVHSSEVLRKRPVL